LVVGSVTATTERTTTSSSFVDVTSGSFSLTVASNSVTLVSMSFEAKNSNGSTGVAAVCGSSGVTGDITAGTDPSFVMTLSNDNAAYVKHHFTVGVHSSVSGTGSQTVKAQFGCLTYMSGTAFIKNVYLSAVNIPL
jgi:hypothetical protein